MRQAAVSLAQVSVVRMGVGELCAREELLIESTAFVVRSILVEGSTVCSIVCNNVLLLDRRLLEEQFVDGADAVDLLHLLDDEALVVEFDLVWR